MADLSQIPNDELLRLIRNTVTQPPPPQSAPQPRSGGGAATAMAFKGLNPVALDMARAVMGDPVGAGRATARGVPVVGSLLDEANAATGAALDPIVADWIAKDIPGKNYGERYENALEQQRGMDRSFDESYPTASTTLQVGGGLVAGGALTRAAPAAAKVAFGNVGRTIRARMAAGATSGGVVGAAHGFGAGEGGAEERLQRAGEYGVTGAAIGGIVPVIAAGAGRLSGAQPPPTMSMDDISTAKKAAYTQAKQSGVVVSGQSWEAFKQQIEPALNQQAIVQPELHTGAVAALNAIKAQSGNIPLERADLLRQVINDAADSAANDGDLMRVMKIKEMFDQFLDNTGNYAAGNAATAVPLLKDARGLAQREFKGRQIQKLINLAESQSARRYGQAGYEQSLRNQFGQYQDRLIRYPHEAKQYTKEELAAIKRVAEGGTLDNVLRALGKWSIGGPMQATLTGFGGYGLGEAIAPGSGPYAAMGAAGLGGLSRFGATQATSNNAMLAHELMRAGGSLPRTQPSAQTDALVQALMQSSAPAGEGEFLRRLNARR